MESDKREATEYFFSDMKMHVKDNCRTIHCILFLGSYTRSEEFNDIDIVTALSGPYATNEGLVAASENDRKKFETMLSWHEAYSIPPIQNLGYFGILQGDAAEKRNVKSETDQMKEYIKSFYDFYAGFNRLDEDERMEYGIEKPPADFRFSAEHSIFIERNDADTQLKYGIVKTIKDLNLEFEQEVSNYRNIGAK